MRKLILLPALLVATGAWADSAELTAALNNVRAACGNISSELNHLKTMAGINTGISATGTALGGVALGTGIAKSVIENKIKTLREGFADNRNKLGITDESITKISVDNMTELLAQADANTKEIIETSLQMHDQGNSIEKLSDKSTLLGNVRTGTLAGATATNIASTAIAATNHVDADLQSQIDTCISNVKILSSIYMQERTDSKADAAELQKTETILSKCGDWQYVDLSSINKRATGAAVAGGIGVGTGLVGTITSAFGNKTLATDASADDQKKHKALNTTANVMAGGTAVAGTVATVFNATQINAIKRATQTAQDCEEALQ